MGIYNLLIYTHLAKTQRENTITYTIVFKIVFNSFSLSAQPETLKGSQLERPA